MNFEEEIKKLVALQATKISMEFTIVDFTEMILNRKDQFICEEAAIDFLNDLKNHYLEFIVQIAEKKVFASFEEKAAQISEREEPLIEEVEDLDELEEVPLEPEEGENDLDLKYVIRNDIYMKNIEIEKSQGKFKEENSENYWMIGIDINELPEEELQKLSIIDMDFW